MKKAFLNILLSVMASIFIIPIAINGAFYLADEKEVKNANRAEVTVENNNADIPTAQVNEVGIDEDDINRYNIDSDFEKYIVGVVAAEMPASFEEEALKAQAVAARTYAVRSGLTVKELENYDGQAYITEEKMHEKWGENYDLYHKKIEDSVLNTAGEIIEYNGEPILAVFHAISGGKTETAENVWQQQLPYLKSVNSQSDEEAKEYYAETKIPADTVISLIQAQEGDLKVSEGNLIDQIQILSRTEAGYIEKIQVGNKIFTGRQIREMLGLRSSNFTVKQEGEDIIFYTKGYGHGAGMSQYGANYMAQQGKNYKEILKYYYSGVEIKKVSQ